MAGLESAEPVLACSTWVCPHLRIVLPCRRSSLYREFSVVTCTPIDALSLPEWTSDFCRSFHSRGRELG